MATSVKTQTLLIDKFPDFHAPGFDMVRFNEQFHNSNMIIHAQSADVEYALHWGPLSVKCAFNGEENYESGNGRYVVDRETFLVFNNGKMYSSWISSPSTVESFTLNITPKFEQRALKSIRPTDVQLEDPFDEAPIDFRFTEKLYDHDALVSPVVKQIRELAKDFSNKRSQLDLMFFMVMENLLLLQNGTNAEIDRIDKTRLSTRIEIYERLVRAKDFIRSCYREDIGLDDMAGVACMNTFYFLRQFRKVFHTTPHKFLMERRLTVAAELLRGGGRVQDVCIEVGFNDPSSFGKLFRRRYGVTPASLRT